MILIFQSSCVMHFCPLFSGPYLECSAVYTGGTYFYQAIKKLGAIQRQDQSKKEMLGHQTCSVLLFFQPLTSFISFCFFSLIYLFRVEEGFELSLSEHVHISFALLLQLCKLHSKECLNLVQRITVCRPVAEVDHILMHCRIFPQ